MKRSSYTSLGLKNCTKRCFALTLNLRSSTSKQLSTEIKLGFSDANLAFFPIDLSKFQQLPDHKFISEWLSVNSKLLYLLFLYLTN